MLTGSHKDIIDNMLCSIGCACTGCASTAEPSNRKVHLSVARYVHSDRWQAMVVKESFLLGGAQACGVCKVYLKNPPSIVTVLQWLAIDVASACHRVHSLPLD